MRNLAISIWALSALAACGEVVEDAPAEAPAPTPERPMVEVPPPPDPVIPEAPRCAPGTRVDPGPALIRRLTRLEYDNAVRDLLGVDLGLGMAQFPPEEESLGFDNNARALQVSPLQAEQFMEAAEVIAAEAVVDLEAILPCAPEPDARACAREFIVDVGRRAWRRHLTDEEIERLIALYDVGAEFGEPAFVNGVQLVIEALLQSPNFLYRLEVGQLNAERPDLLKLTADEVAARLSFLILRSIPDDALLAAADAGELDTVTGVVDQARRLVALPRARAAAWSFFEQWLHLDRLERIERDPRWYPEYSPHLRELLGEEARRFVESVVWDAGDMRMLLSASYSFMNRELAEFYGLEGPRGEAFEKVALDPERRSGVVTTGAVMAVTAKPNMTSPVHRGIFVREQLLCTALPPPPANVPIIPPDPDPSLTTREAFAVHSANDACAGCHVLIDGIGFGFEHYDALGRFRITENGKPIDATGDVVLTQDADGAFDGAPELARRLADSEHVQRCMTTQAFRFAYGRGENPADDCAREALFQAFVDGGYRYDALLVGLVQSDAFRFRRPDPETPVEAP